MGAEVRARFGRDLYPSIRTICGGGMPEKYEHFLAEQQSSRRGTVDLHHEPTELAEVDLNELRAFVEKTGYCGLTALEQYAFEKVEREKREGLR
jgi:hypothetical protein